jgi:hypothetical protein
MNRCVKLLVALLVAVSPVAAAPADSAALPTRDINIKGHVHNPPYITGSVNPRYRWKPVVIQRKKCHSGCAWKPYKKVKTNGKSLFRATVQWPKAGHKLFFRAKVNRSGGYATSYSNVLVDTRG